MSYPTPDTGTTNLVQDGNARILMTSSRQFRRRRFMFAVALVCSWQLGRFFEAREAESNVMISGLHCNVCADCTRVRCMLMFQSKPAISWMNETSARWVYLDVATKARWGSHDADWSEISPPVDVYLYEDGDAQSPYEVSWLPGGAIIGSQNHPRAMTRLAFSIPNGYHTLRMDGWLSASDGQWVIMPSSE